MISAVSEVAQKQAIINVDDVASHVAKSCLLLDREEFDAWMECCASEFVYRITAYSPEINRDMTWLEADRTELKFLFSDLRSHVRVLGAFFRHLGSTIGTPGPDGEPGFTTSVAIFHTTLPGVTKIFGACRYNDRWLLENGLLRLRAREVRLDTRCFDFGMHVIL